MADEAIGKDIMMLMGPVQPLQWLFGASCLPVGNGQEVDTSGAGTAELQERWRQSLLSSTSLSQWPVLCHCALESCPGCLSSKVACAQSLRSQGIDPCIKQLNDRLHPEELYIQRIGDTYYNPSTELEASMRYKENSKTARTI